VINVGGCDRHCILSAGGVLDKWLKCSIAIAEEKERKTLDFLLASDLRSREIVLGKLASRLAYLTLVLLTGLPLLMASTATLPKGSGVIVGTTTT